MNELEQQVTDFALFQHETNARLEVARAMRAHFYALYVEAYDAEIAAAEDALKLAGAKLKAALLEYVEDTGDVSSFPAGVTYRRVKTWMYDEGEMIAACRQHAPELLTTTLKKADLNRRFGEDMPDWMQAEQVHSHTIALGRLGDYVIKARQGGGAEEWT